MAVPRRLSPFVTLVALALCATSTQAQDAGSLLKQQESRPDAPRFPLDAVKEQVRPALKPGAGIKVRIKAIRFTGAVDLVPETELREVVAEALGQELDFAALEQLAQRVTDHLRRRGWFLARAYLPRQDLTEGHLEIALLAGRLDGKEGQGRPWALLPGGDSPLRIAPERLDAIAATRLQAGAGAREADIERVVLLMSDLPGIAAKARLEPGSEADSTRIAIDVREGPLFSGSVGAGNGGNHATGSGQVTALLQANDPLRMGDQFSLGMMRTEGLDLARLGYSLPLGAEGTRLGLNATHMTYEHIRGAGKTAGLEGKATTWGAAVSHPLLRSRLANVHVSAAYTHKSLRDDSIVGNLRDKRIDAGEITLSGDRFDGLAGGGLNFANLGYTAGELDLSANAADAALDAAGYATQGRYRKWTWRLGRLQKLPGAFTFYANLSGQSAGGNLDSSEQFILGGPYGVRAYPISEASGDSGWLANLELRYDLPGIDVLGRMQLVGFYDAGRITLRDDTRAIPIATASGDNHYGLAGWGVGVNLGKTGSHNLRLAWARRIGDNPGRGLTGLDADERADKSRFWLDATLFF